MGFFKKLVGEEAKSKREDLKDIRRQEREKREIEQRLRLLQVELDVLRRSTG